MYNGHMKVMFSSYLEHLKKYQSYIKLHMYITNILNLYQRYLYKKYIMSTLHVYPRFMLLKLNDFDITITINVY
jgi:hypothetical protein